MYLNRLTLNPAHPQARRDLANAYDMHRSLTRAFAADEHTPPPRFLWRLERERSGLAGTQVLVQAPEPARWEALPFGAGYAERLDANKFVAPERLVQAGARYRFRLLANPTVTREGRRWGLHDDDARKTWLRRQGARHGFEVLLAERGASGRLRASQGRRDCAITLDAVLFDGVLQATDAEALRQAWAAGIGPGKALGLGMLSLAPLAALK
jgi:CRISPR system Cascade subunit CasE